MRLLAICKNKQCKFIYKVFLPFVVLYWKLLLILQRKRMFLKTIFIYELKTNQPPGGGIFSRLVYFLFLPLLSIFSCETTREVMPEPEQTVEHYVSQDPGVIYVSMERSFNPSTKVSVAGSTGTASWTSGDQIAYCVTNGSSTQYNTATVDVSNSNILPDMASGYYRANYAVYPAASAGTDYTTPTVVYPTSYDLSGKTAETYSPVPMVATNTGSSMAFYHVGSLLRLHLTNVNSSTTKVTVRFDGITDVTGTYTVSNAGTASASMSVSTGGGNIVTFTSVPVASNETYLNIPLPSGSYSSLASLTLCGYDSYNDLLQERCVVAPFSSNTRAHAKNAEYSMEPRFGGLMIAPGPLYFDNSSKEFGIRPGWNWSSYNNAMGLQTNSTYFNYINLGQRFDSRGSSFTDSSGDIDNANKLSYGGFDDWRLPTQAEFYTLTTGESPGTSRQGSTVNGLEGCKYALIRLTGITHSGSSTPYGLLLFPDGSIITGKNLTSVNTATSTVGVNSSELSNYINQGCVFLPAGGYYGVQAGWTTGGTRGVYRSANENSGSGDVILFQNNILQNGAMHKTNGYNTVRLVR